MSRGFLFQLASVLLVAGVLSSPAAAAPIVYTMQGTLLTSGADTLGLSGATLVVVATLDTDNGPVATTTSISVVTATFDPTLSAAFSNRPAGAPDVMLNYVSQVQAQNFFPPGTTPDAVALFSAPATFEGNGITMPALTVFFPNQTFLPGTGVPPLPLFAPTDVATLAVGSLRFGQEFYTVSNRSVTAVPEPGTALSVVLGLGIISAMRRRR